jgi:hypothetical protein
MANNIHIGGDEFSRSCFLENQALTNIINEAMKNLAANET